MGLKLIEMKKNLLFSGFMLLFSIFMFSDSIKDVIGLVNNDLNCDQNQTISLSSNNGRHDLTFSKTGDVLNFSTSGVTVLDGMKIGCQELKVTKSFSFTNEFGSQAYLINISNGNSVVVQ